MSLNNLSLSALGASLACAGVMTAHAQAVPGGTLDPLSIPKYVEPLVIPPVMPDAPAAAGVDYEIALRQFDQQVLPTIGCTAAASPACGTGGEFPLTTQWGYGDPNTPSTFNNPAFTVEAIKDMPTSVRWINELVADPDACAASPTPATDPACNFLTHVVKDQNGLGVPVVDQTLHWAAPNDNCANGLPGDTDCRGNTSAPYLGPTPMVTHVHGADVGPISDGYPEAWWLPAANNIPAGTATSGTFFNDETNADAGMVVNPGDLGYAEYRYPEDQPTTTLWYHDHSLGMTRLNVYAAGAGFWLIRNANGREDGLQGTGVLPGPAPTAADLPADLNTPGSLVRDGIREIPIAIQDKSFNNNGTLFYPADRAFFEGLGTGQVLNDNTGLNIPFLPNTATSDISPIWNPEAFFNTMVVNGRTWPVLEVAPERYRFRLLNANDSRFLNLAMFEVKPNGGLFTNRELPFYQIGAEQSLLADVVRIQTGTATPLPGNGQDVCTTGSGKPKGKGKGAGNVPCVPALPASDPQQALLMGPAERADVVVDFTGLDAGTRIRMINTAPDAPFGGFPDVPADPATTGQVMEFVVALPADGDPSTPPASLMIQRPADGPPLVGGTLRRVGLLEEESALICVTVDALTGVVTATAELPPCAPPALPFAPKAAVLGAFLSPVDALPTTTLWDEPIHQNPGVGDTEIWEMYNVSADAHPIHIHLVKFEVLDRELAPAGMPSGIVRPPEPSESGWKDTVIALPGEITRVRMRFDRAGLYVWHCHILSHEDNEMMVPYCVGNPETDCGGLPVTNVF